MTQKAIYKPTSQKTIVLNEYDGYCEILLDNEYKTVSKNDPNFEQDYESLSSFSEFKEVIFLNCIKNPLSDVLCSLN